MNRIVMTLAVVAPLAAGCVTPTHVRTPAAQPPIAYEAPRPPVDSLTPANLEQWWSLYNDPQLNELVARALANAPDARDAVARLQQAAAIRAGTIDQIILPTSTLSGTATHSQTDVLSGSAIGGGPTGFTEAGPSNSLNAGFNVSWELDLFGRRAAARTAADADFFTAAYTYEATRTALAANVAQSLFQARGLALQLRDAQEIARIDHELERLARVRVEHGLSAQPDLDQASATAQAADAQAESLRAQLDTARRTLLVLIGSGFDPLASLVATPDVGSPPPVPAEVPGDLLRRRPDVRAAEWRITSAKGNLRLDELAVLPTLKLNPGVTLAKSTGVFGTSTAIWSIGAGLTAPVLDRPRLIEQIHAEAAVAEQDVIAYEKAVQTAYGETENAFINLDSDQRRVDLLVAAEAKAESAYSKGRLSYGRGLTDLATALQAETTWRNIRTQRSQAQAIVMQRSVQVFKALGGGWNPEAPAATTPYATTAAKAVAGGG